MKLNIPTLDSKWHDKDNIMLHACFQCLVDFIEKEKPDEFVDWEGTGSEAAAARKEMQALYEWWKEHASSAQGWYDMYEDEQAKLKRLIEIRGYMWT